MEVSLEAQAYANYMDRLYGEFDKFPTNELIRRKDEIRQGKNTLREFLGRIRYFLSEEGLIIDSILDKRQKASGLEN